MLPVPLQLGCPRHGPSAFPERSQTLPPALPSSFSLGLAQGRSNLCFSACMRQNPAPNKPVQWQNGNKHVPKAICEVKGADPPSRVYSGRSGCWDGAGEICSALGLLQASELCWGLLPTGMKPGTKHLCMHLGRIQRQSLTPKKICQIQKSRTNSPQPWHSNGLDGKTKSG